MLHALTESIDIGKRYLKDMKEHEKSSHRQNSVHKHGNHSKT